LRLPGPMLLGPIFSKKDLVPKKNRQTTRTCHGQIKRALGLPAGGIALSSSKRRTETILSPCGAKPRTNSGTQGRRPRHEPVYEAPPSFGSNFPPSTYRPGAPHHFPFHVYARNTHLAPGCGAKPFFRRRKNSPFSFPEIGLRGGEGHCWFFRGPASVPRTRGYNSSHRTLKKPRGAQAPVAGR